MGPLIYLSVTKYRAYKKYLIVEEQSKKENADKVLKLTDIKFEAVALSDLSPFKKLPDEESKLEINKVDPSIIEKV